MKMEAISGNFYDTNTYSTSFIRVVRINEIWFNYATLKHSYLRHKIHFPVENHKNHSEQEGKH